MRIAENINIQPEKLSSGFSAALRICKKINGSQDQRDVIDFSHARFVTPTFVMPLLYKEISKRHIYRPYRWLSEFYML